MNKKRILYTFCFCLLNIIDFVCNTQNGDIQSVAVKAMGLVLLVIVGSGYPVRDLLTRFN